MKMTLDELSKIPTITRKTYTDEEIEHLDPKEFYWDIWWDCWMESDYALRKRIKKEFKKQ